MKNRRSTSIFPTLALCLALATIADTAVAEPQGDWAAAIAAYNRGDYAAASRLIRGLAERGDADAQYDIAVMYQIGEDAPQDYVQAYKWYSLAALNFTAADADMRDRAFKNRDRIALLMTPAQIAEALRLAREWKPR